MEWNLGRIEFFDYFLVIVFREAIEYPTSFRKIMFIARLVNVVIASCNQKDAPCLVYDFMLLRTILLVFTRKKWKSGLKVHMCLVRLLESKLIFLMTFLYLTIRKINLKIHYYIFFSTLLGLSVQSHNRQEKVYIVFIFKSGSPKPEHLL